MTAILRQYYSAIYFKELCESGKISGFRTLKGTVRSWEQADDGGLFPECFELFWSINIDCLLVTFYLYFEIFQRINIYYYCFLFIYILKRSEN